MNKLNNILKILTLKEKRGALKLLVLIFIGMLLEVLGVSLIIPALLFIVQPDIALQYPGLSPILQFLGSPDQIQLVMGGMILLLIVYFLKAGFLTYMNMVQSAFVYGIQASLSRRLFAGYMYNSYSSHLQRNSAELIRNTVNEVAAFVGVMNAAAIVVTEIVVLIGLLIMLTLIEPVGITIAAVILLLFSYIYYRKTKERLLSWGKRRQKNEGMRIQHLQQGLHSLKDIKILGREDNFIVRYSINNFESADMSRRMSVISALPRLWLEFLSVFIVVMLVVYMVYTDKDLTLMIPTIGVFAAAAFRLMPSVHRIIVNIQNLRYALPVIELLKCEIKKFNESNNGIIKKHDIDIKKTIIVDKVGFSYGKSSKQILNNVSVEIPFGSVTGFIGESGSGKSTLIDIILGLLEPTSGSVYVGSSNIQTNLKMWQKNIGYVPQSIYLTDDSLRNNIAYGIDSELIDDSQVNKVINMVKLSEFLETQHDGLNTMIGEHGAKLSGGQRQRIGIARALYHSPKILVLDEATSALDSETEKEVMQTIDSLRGNRTIVIVTHKMSNISNCNQVYKIKGGNLYEFKL